MLPEIADLEFNPQTAEATTTMGTSFLFDFSKGDFVSKDGKIIKLTGIEAVKVWIQKVIRTEKFHFEVYNKTDGSDEYGITVQDLIVGNDLPKAFIEAELQRELSEALTKHPNIKSVSDFVVTKDNPKVTLQFTVNLTDGTSINAYYGSTRSSSIISGGSVLQPQLDATWVYFGELTWGDI